MDNHSFKTLFALLGAVTVVIATFGAGKILIEQTARPVNSSMSKPYHIQFWHGINIAAERELIANMESICGPADTENNIFFKGSLEEFATKYNAPFLYYPPYTDNEKEHTSGTIWVTQYGRFSAR